MRRTYISALILVLAFPAAALAARGAARPVRVGLGDAHALRAAPLQRPVEDFRRLVRVEARRIRAAARKRHLEAFATLPAGVTIATLDAIGSCESGGDPTAVSSGGTYRGKYQFDYGTWESVGGHGDPAAASEAEQDYRAALLYSRSGSSPWPVCG